MYVERVASEIAVHAVPVAGQRCHWYENVIGVVPDHLPLPAVSVRPSASTPVNDGASVAFGLTEVVGGVVETVTTRVGGETAVAVPAEFLAVTARTILAPASADCTMYDCEVAPGIGEHDAPAELQRRHSYVYVIGSDPVHVPLLEVRTEPVSASPEMDGGNELAGAVPTRTLLGSETAVAVPKLFVAVTATRSREPISAVTGVYELVTAPAMSAQVVVFVALQRRHW